CLAWMLLLDLCEVYLPVPVYQRFIYVFKYRLGIELESAVVTLNVHSENNLNLLNQPSYGEGLDEANAYSLNSKFANFSCGEHNAVKSSLADKRYWLLLLLFLACLKLKSVCIE
ncbi:hypothetical protein Tco_0805111, partial [Tanacetum coccineum]